MSHLIYVGKDYNDFIGEAKRYGVSRNIPAQSAYGLEWGEEVFCATFDPYTKEYFQALGMEPNRTGNAKLICSFRFEELFIKEPPLHAAVMAELIERGLVSNIEATDIEIERDCGAFVISSIAEVKVEVGVLIQIIRDLAKKLDLKPQIMIGGPLIQEFPEEEYVPGVKFTRGMMRFKDSTPGKSSPKVIGIHSYQHFWTEEERMAYKSGTLEVFDQKKEE
jgi:hypothetical protein